MIELPSDQLEVFKFSEKAFHAAQIEERELQMDGKMYDIARIEKKNNTVHVYCLRDHAEENLLGFLDTMLKRLDDDSSQLPTAVFGFTLLQFIPSEFNFQPSARSCISILNTLYTNIYHFTDIEFETPPPRCWP